MCCLRSTFVPVLSARRKFVCLTPILASQRETLCERVSVLSRLLYCQPRMVSRPGKGYIDGSLPPCCLPSSSASQQPSTSSKQRLLKSRLPSSSLVYHHIKTTKSNQTNHHHHNQPSTIKMLPLVAGVSSIDDLPFAKTGDKLRAFLSGTKTPKSGAQTPVSGAQTPATPRARSPVRKTPASSAPASRSASRVSKAMEKGYYAF